MEIVQLIETNERIYLFSDFELMWFRPSNWIYINFARMLDKIPNS